MVLKEANQLTDTLQDGLFTYTCTHTHTITYKYYITALVFCWQMLLMNCSVTELGNRHIRIQGNYSNISIFYENKPYILLLKMCGKNAIQFPLHIWKITCFAKVRTKTYSNPFSYSYK